MYKSLNKKINNPSILQTIALIFGLLISAPLYAGEIYTKSILFEKDKIKIQVNENESVRPKVGLVLSGGGARGVVHIGVLKALEKNNIPLDLTVGTSVGSVIGGLYASGYSPDQIANIMGSIDWNDIYRDETQRTSLFLQQKGEQDRYLLPIRFNGLSPYIPTAFSPGQKVLTILSDLFLKAQYQARNNFDNLKTPFRVVTTDLISGKRVVLKEGNLAESINASLAVPLLFAPVAIDSMLLVDGGLRSNLPVDVAKETGMDIVIAVDVTSRLRSRDELNAPWEIADQVTTIMSVPSRKLQQRQADILIQPELGDFSNTDFKRLNEMVEAGEKAAENKINEIKKQIYKGNKTENKQYLIQKVKFNCEENVLPVTLFEKLSVRNGKIISSTDILEDLDILIKSGAYRKVEAEFDTINQAAIVTFKLDRFSIIKEIDFTGNKQFSGTDLNAVIFTGQGGRLNSNTLRADLDRIMRLYRKGGFALMRIKQIDWNNAAGILQIEIDEGRIGNILITGNDKTKDYVILREFSAQKGKVFNWIVVHKAIQNVYSTQLYERVNVDIVEEEGENNLIIKVKEKSSLVMHLGGKLDLERKAQAYIEFGDESFLGTAIKTSFISRIGARDKHFGLKIRDDRIFTTHFTFALNGYYNWEVNPIYIERNLTGEYQEERRGIRFQAGWQMQRLGQLIAELRMENIKDKRFSGYFDLSQNVELRTFAIRSITDKRDRIDFPTKGIYNYWLWESGNKLILDSQEPYTKAIINLEGFYTLNNVHTLHLRLLAGVGDKTLPFSENFRMGGLHSFYGLHENEYFGKQLFITNIEYRLKLPIKMIGGSYFSMRYDFAGIWDDPALIFTSDDFFSALGGCLAFDTMLGPLYFAWGRITRGYSAGYISWGFNF